MPRRISLPLKSGGRGGDFKQKQPVLRSLVKIRPSSNVVMPTIPTFKHLKEKTYAKTTVCIRN